MKRQKLENNKVYLTFGRHGRYGNDTAIERLSMLEAYLSGKELKKICPPCDIVFHSPIARAVQTAEFRALGLDCEHLTETQKLSEDCPAFEIKKFLNFLLVGCDNERHLHFVTHLPVIEKLGLGELGCGEIFVCEADSWQEMLCENFTIKLMSCPDIEECLNLLHKAGISAAEFHTLTAQKILSALTTL